MSLDGPPLTRTSLDEVRDIIAMPAGHDRDNAVTTFIHRRNPMFVNVARRLCRINSVQPQHYYDDIYAIVLATAWEMLAKAIEDPDSMDTIINWDAIFFRQARARVRSEVDRMSSVASGMTTARRRHREVQRSRSELRSLLMREPSNEEMINHANKRLSGRSDQKNQGMVITHEDVDLPSKAPDASQALETHTYIDFSEDCILHPLDWQHVIEQTVTRCCERDPDLGKVATLWVHDVYNSAGECGPDLVTYICRTAELKRPHVEELIEQVRLVARDVLAQRGINY